MTTPKIPLCSKKGVFQSANTDTKRKGENDKSLIIEELLKSGKKPHEIAALVNISERTVYRKAKNLGLKKKKIEVSAVELKEMVATGKSDLELAQIYGCSLRTMIKCRNDNGVPSYFGHGGAREGSGRHKVYHPNEKKYLMDQQTADCICNSMEVGIHTYTRVSNYDLIRWAGSAYKINKTKTMLKYASDSAKPADIPSSINLVVEKSIVDFGNKKNGKLNTGDVQKMQGTKGY